MKTEYYGSALEDANKAIDLDKKYIKVQNCYDSFIKWLQWSVLLLNWVFVKSGIMKVRTDSICWDFDCSGSKPTRANKILGLQH